MPVKKRPAHVTRENWDAVDVPELSGKEIANMRPAAEVVPDIVASFQRTRGPQKAPKKVQVTLRLDPDILDHYKAKGAGWQTQINNDLRRAAGPKPRG